jgi:biopolymer transport protein ExbD
MSLALTDGGASRRRSVDSDLNMVPMIDLLMVTIAFLLITAAWTHAARLEADTSAPGLPGPTSAPEETRLHVDMNDPARFVLRWSDGATVVGTREVARREVVTLDHGTERTVRFPELARALDDEWHASGLHRAADDRALDELVLHTADDVPYASLVGAMDAAYGVKRTCGAAMCGAFHVVLATR